MGGLRNVCVKCGKVVPVKRADLKGWKSDPRITHLKEKHGIDTTILGDYFRIVKEVVPKKVKGKGRL